VQNKMENKSEFQREIEEDVRKLNEFYDEILPYGILQSPKK